MLKKFKLKGGLEIKIKKGVPAGFGIGSSAASAAATSVGINKLFNLKLDANSLVEFAGVGEKDRGDLRRSERCGDVRVHRRRADPLDAVRPLKWPRGSLDGITPRVVVGAPLEVGFRAGRSSTPTAGRCSSA